MLFAFIGLYRGGLAVFAADAAGSAANGTAPAAIVSVAAAGNGRVSAVQRIGGIFCRGAAGRLCSPFSAWDVVRLEHFAADDHPCGSGAALADAIRDWSIVFAAAGSKGNAVALEPVLLLCVSSAVGRKYAALPAAVSGAVCSDTGIIRRIVIALSGAAKIAGSLDINKRTLEHRTT